MESLDDVSLGVDVESVREAFSLLQSVILIFSF